jgi:hypothetical protein
VLPLQEIEQMSGKRDAVFQKFRNFSKDHGKKFSTVSGKTPTCPIVPLHLQGLTVRKSDIVN